MNHEQYRATLVAIVLAASAPLCRTAVGQAAKANSEESKPVKVKKDHHSPDIRKHDLGTTTIAGLRFESITQEGPVIAGEEGAFDVVIAEGQKPPKAMRAWIGLASGEGSMKTRLEKEPQRHYHSHVEAPDPLPAGSQYWLEVEPESGAKAKAGFTFFTEE